VALLHLQRVAAQVVAVKLDQVEGVEEDACVMPPVADAVEARHAVVVAGDSFVVDDAGARAQPRLDDQREAVGQVVVRSAVPATPSSVSMRLVTPSSRALLPCTVARQRWRMAAVARITRTRPTTASPSSSPTWRALLPSMF
jgi:hypothetical protein